MAHSAVVSEHGLFQADRIFVYGLPEQSSALTTSENFNV
jgi:hypothetical protein